MLHSFTKMRCIHSPSPKLTLKAYSGVFDNNDSKGLAFGVTHRKTTVGFLFTKSHSSLVFDTFSIPVTFHFHTSLTSKTSMPKQKVIRLPVVSPVINNGSAINGLRSAIAPINALVTDTFQCNVCQENCTADPYVVPACLHSYCGDCIHECLRMFGNECPACLVNGTSNRDLCQDNKIDNVSMHFVTGCHDQFRIRKHSRIVWNQLLQMERSTEDTMLLQDLDQPAQGLVRFENNKRARCEDSEEMQETGYCMVSPLAGVDTGCNKRSELDATTDKSCCDERRAKERKYSRFDARFDELAEFKNNFGHCDVPKQYSENPTLGSWCHTLRKVYKDQQKPSMYLSTVHIERLESLGFNWIGVKILM